MSDKSSANDLQGRTSPPSTLGNTAASGVGNAAATKLVLSQSATSAKSGTTGTMDAPPVTALPPGALHNIHAVPGLDVSPIDPRECFF